MGDYPRAAQDLREGLELRRGSGLSAAFEALAATAINRPTSA